MWLRDVMGLIWLLLQFLCSYGVMQKACVNSPYYQPKYVFFLLLQSTSISENQVDISLAGTARLLAFLFGRSHFIGKSLLRTSSGIYFV